jgi:dTDP-4-dehydrorhamnose 3,5-epimerase
MFKFGDINGVVVSELSRHHDERGSLTEIWRSDDKSGYRPAMCYISETNTYVARGPHEHIEQSDLFIANGPGGFLFNLWDNRPNSATYGNMMQLYAGGALPKAILVPPGVVHGYLCIAGPGVIVNLPDVLYAGPLKQYKVDEIRHEADPDTPFKMPSCRPYRLKSLA